MEGWIYIVSNPSMPGLLKIGRTTRAPQERMAELAQATGVPSQFVLEYREHVTHCIAAEFSIHQKLRTFRWNENREFFRISVPSAVERVAAVCEPHRTGIGNRDADVWLSRVHSKYRGLGDAIRPAELGSRLYICPGCGRRFRIERKSERRLVECGVCGRQNFI